MSLDFYFDSAHFLYQNTTENDQITVRFRRLNNFVIHLS